MTSSQEILTDKEIETIIISACTVKTHTEGELKGLIEWATKARLDAAFLNLVLTNRLNVSWQNGEPTFTNP